MASDDITVQILRDIRDGIQGTNKRLDETNRRIELTNQRIDETNHRVDRLAATTSAGLAEVGRAIKKS